MHGRTNTTSTFRYFLYTRKSTDEEDRQVRSLDDQAGDLAEVIAKRELRVVDTLKESRSAKTKGRPIFNEMLRRIEAGEADGIIAWHPDRLSRNAFDGGYLIDLLDIGKLCDLQFYNFWFENTSQGKSTLANAFTQGKYYSDNLSDVVSRAMRRKRAEGIWPGFAPIGYINDRNARCIVPDPARGPLVRRAFETYAAGRDHWSEATREAKVRNGHGGSFGLGCLFGRPNRRLVPVAG